VDNIVIYCAYMAMAAFLAWTLFRGVKTGVLAGETYSYDRDANPLGFALSFAMRIAVIGFLPGRNGSRPGPERRSDGRACARFWALRLRRLSR
jgi:hypothetical protein